MFQTAGRCERIVWKKMRHYYWRMKVWVWKMKKSMSHAMATPVGSVQGTPMQVIETVIVLNGLTRGVCVE